MSTSRIGGATLLLIILVDSFSTTLSAGFEVTGKEVRRCRCSWQRSQLEASDSNRLMTDPNRPRSHHSHGRKMMKCPFPLVPTNNKERKSLINCICSNLRRRDLPRFHALCQATAMHGFYPVTLM